MLFSQIYVWITGSKEMMVEINHDAGGVSIRKTNKNCVRDEKKNNSLHLLMI